MARSPMGFHMRRAVTPADGAPAGLSDEARKRIRKKAQSRARRHDAIGHLGPEAVVAFVDGEMDCKSTHRVRVHLVHCPECRREVHTQRGASEWVRHCDEDADIHIPQDLFHKLTSIATTPQPEPAPADEDAPYTGERDFLDKVEMVFRAIKHNQRG